MADVFISYASEDRETARKLAGVLEAQGWSVWWDRKIVAGQTFDQVIERELETSKAAVVLWSRNSVASEWVKNEAAAAVERGVLVPVLIEQVKLPLEFRRKQTVDLAGWNGDETHSGLPSLYEGISVAITGAAPRQSVPVAPPPSPSPFPLRRFWMAASIAAVVVVLGFVAYLKPWQDGKDKTIVTRVEPDSDRAELNRRLQGRETPTTPDQGETADYAAAIRQLSADQRIALKMLIIGQDKSAGLRKIEGNLVNIDKTVRSFPNDRPQENVNLYVSMGYALKDMYQNSKSHLPSEMRHEYLSRARGCFAQALRLDRRNASAYNGMGNVLFLEGKFDEALKYHARALNLAGGKDKYPAAEHDRQLVIKVRDGVIPFDF